MAIENHKKEQEVLRLLWLEGGGYTRNELASMLALSPDSIGNVLKELRAAAASEEFIQNAWPSEKEVCYILDTASAHTNPLLCLYSLTSVRKSEVEGYEILLTLLAKSPARFQEILVNFCQTLNVPPDAEENSKNTVTRYLRELTNAGFIRKKSEHREKYTLSPCLSEICTTSELKDLLDFIRHESHIGKLTVYGWQILNKLHSHITQKAAHTDALQYRHACFGKILDEYMVYELQECCIQKKPIRIMHYPSQQPCRYNPAKVARRQKVKNKRPRTTDVIPLKILYDRMYSRWYFFGFNLKTHHYDAIRIDTIQMHQSLPTTIKKEEVAALQKEADKKLATCRLIPDSVSQIIKLRFFSPNQKLKQQLKEACSNGQILQESEAELIWSCIISDLNAIKPWIRSFGYCAEVLEPLSLRNELATEWERIVHLYE